MLTYGFYENGKFKRVKQTDENVIAAYKRVDSIMDKLDNDSIYKLFEAIANYVCKEASADDKALIKSYKIRLTDATVWYCHDAD